MDPSRENRLPLPMPKLNICVYNFVFKQIVIISIHNKVSTYGKIQTLKIIQLKIRLSDVPYVDQFDCIQIYILYTYQWTEGVFSDRAFY